MELVKEGNDTNRSACVKDESGCHVADRERDCMQSVKKFVQSSQFLIYKMEITTSS